MNRVTNKVISNKKVKEALEGIKLGLMVDLGLSEKKVKAKGKGKKEEKESNNNNESRNDMEKRSKTNNKELKNKTKNKHVTSNLYMDNLADIKDEEFKQLYGAEGRNRMGQRQRRQ
ncbi:hypothetical protein K502DRAFT_13761 [Neoconidiobolus thromboides FSU 785]|nr:hypothetical protein K502DRAFT_13761 [Neoconidiobolus thromboides FSU 785]